jgi:MoaA/NifB/PqqE/SkfB family radical SAM enzyme
MINKKNFIPIIEQNPQKVNLARAIAEELDDKYDLDLKSVVYGNGDWTDGLRKKVPPNLCLYPFTHFQLDPDGRARPCCKYKVGDASWQQNVPKLPDVDIGELWDQEEFQLLRDQFLRNMRPSGCKACWDEEAAGIKSMRMQREECGTQHPFATFFHHIPRTYPKTLDLKLSNLCNLKCRICTPFLSSQWIKETKDLNVIDMGFQESFVNNSREKFSANPNNEEILKQWAPTIDFLEFYGGEPLMQQEHNKILRIVTEHGKPSNTGLYYNTNGTICDEEFFKLWASFKEVIINFSIDDIGERFEYQRKNAKWNEVLKNIEMYKEYSKKYNVNMTLKFYTTVGILNVFYLDEFINYVKQYNIPVMLNMVHYPHHFSIVNLPDKVKHVIKEKLLTIDEQNILDPWSPKIENIINFMYGNTIDDKIYKLFFEKVNIHDAYRNESFETTFPEFYKILKSHE